MLLYRTYQRKVLVIVAGVHGIEQDTTSYPYHKFKREWEFTLNELLFCLLTASFIRFLKHGAEAGTQ